MGPQGWSVGIWVVMAGSMVTFWAIVAFGVVALVRYLGHNHGTPMGPASGPASKNESILSERLARGEIDEEEFRKTLTLLRES